jgi:hypothetical protein
VAEHRGSERAQRLWPSVRPGQRAGDRNRCTHWSLIVSKTSSVTTGIRYPDDIFAWREANAAAIAALEVRAEPAVREAEAGP